MHLHETLKGLKYNTIALFDAKGDFKIFNLDTRTEVLAAYAKENGMRFPLDSYLVEYVVDRTQLIEHIPQFNPKEVIKQRDKQIVRMQRAISRALDQGDVNLLRGLLKPGDLTTDKE